MRKASIIIALKNTSSKGAVGAVFWVFVSVYSRVWGRHAPELLERILRSQLDKILA